MVSKSTRLLSNAEAALLYKAETLLLFKPEGLSSAMRGVDLAARAADMGLEERRASLMKRGEGGGGSRLMVQ